MDGSRAAAFSAFVDPPTSLFYPPVEVSGLTVAIGAKSLVVTRTGVGPWTTIPLGLPVGELPSAMREIDANTLLVGTTRGRLLNIAWNGTSWTKTQLASPTPRYISCIAVDPSNAQRFWVTISQVSQGTGLVYRSDDAGGSWVNRTAGLPKIPMNAVVVDPANFRRVWVAADVGVYQTLDLGSTWTPFANAPSERDGRGPDLSQAGSSTHLRHPEPRRVGDAGPVGGAMKTRRLTLTGRPLPAQLNLARPGMPSADSIHEARRVITARGQRFRILRTTEVDDYESTPAAVALRKALRGRATPSPTALMAAMKKKPAGDQFAGTARKAAKLSIASGPTKSFNDVKTLIASFVPDDTMVAHKPKITTTAASGRVSAENKNVKVKAFLYAASREDDNDFHLIIGRAPTKSPEMYLTIEVSGLPPQNSPALGPLTATRNAFKAFFGADLPGFTYDFYDPPIPVTVTGSLFFDMGHSTGQRPGPPSLKSRMPTIWEVHPVTAITLG